MAANLERSFYSPAGETVSHPTPIHQIKRRPVVNAIIILACCFGIWFLSDIPVKVSPDVQKLVNFLDRPKTLFCSQVNAIAPEAHRGLWDVVNAKISSPEFRVRAVDWLAGAVRVPTESFDGMGPVGVDPRWEVMGPFHNYLLAEFPLVHATLTLTKVNTYGLHYEWKGTNPSLKPLLLAAHQDVVPVEPATVDEWKYPPYSGHFDGENIWGRGSFDDKSGLIGMMSAIEILISSGFRPTRTLVLAFGFDEEASGLRGAGFLGPHLEKVYGRDGFAMIVDEGAGFSERFGSVLATPGIAEKGCLNTHVKVTAPGGHSSLPPAHTSIGILSRLLVQLERHPTKVEITRQDPIYETLQCLAEHSKSMPSIFRDTIKHSANSDKALRHLQKFIQSDDILSSVVRTTQAIDVIQGGVKSNALPEQAWAIVNHRIAVFSSVDEVKARDTKLLEKLAKEFNLTYDAFGSHLSEEGAPSKGTLTLSDSDHAGFEPAPVSPTGEGSGPYRLLSGTIKATYNAHRSIEGDPSSLIVAPSMMSGNTDTRFYWNLTKHIFRYSHHNAGNGSELGSIHTVNEHMEADSFYEIIRFFTTFILNVDESTIIQWVHHQRVHARVLHYSGRRRIQRALKRNGALSNNA